MNDTQETLSFDKPTPTRAAFLAAYRLELKRSYPALTDDARDSHLARVHAAIMANGRQWQPGATNVMVKRAIRAVGGHVGHTEKITLKYLRALP